MNHDWVKLLPVEGNVVVLEMQGKSDFEVDRDQPFFEYLFETCVVEAQRAGAVVSICVDARKCNFLSFTNVPSMLGRFMRLVNHLHSFPMDGRNVDIVSGHLGSTAIVIGSEGAKTLINMIVSVIPTRRPVEFFTSVEEAIQFGRAQVASLKMN